MTIDPLIATS